MNKIKLTNFKEFEDKIRELEEANLQLQSELSEEKRKFKNINRRHNELKERVSIIQSVITTQTSSVCSPQLSWKEEEKDYYDNFHF